jgi:1-acyl-sn-glycerol-3-phosphate acyltransferase
MAGRKHYRPFLKVAADTLTRSAKIAIKDRLGTLDQGYVDDILVGWHHAIYDAGKGSLEVFGADHVKDAARGAADVAVGKRSYVVMTNHQSLLDVPTVIATFPGRIRMVGKRELGKVPIWGHAMRAAGVVFVDRGNRQQSIAALDTAKGQLQAGTSIWIAPEGTRSRDGSLLPLKKGGFHLATQLGAPIAPAWLTGTKQIIDPESFGVTMNGHVTIRYGAPIATEGKSVAELMELVRAALLDLQQQSLAYLAGK